MGSTINTNSHLRDADEARGNEVAGRFRTSARLPPVPYPDPPPESAPGIRTPPSPMAMSNRRHRPPTKVHDNRQQRPDDRPTDSGTSAEDRPLAAAPSSSAEVRGASGPVRLTWDSGAPPTGGPGTRPSHRAPYALQTLPRNDTSQASTSTPRSAPGQSHLPSWAHEPPGMTTRWREGPGGRRTTQGSRSSRSPSCCPRPHRRRTESHRSGS